MGHDLSSSLLELPELPQEIPETRLGNNLVSCKDSHPVKRSDGLALCGEFPADDTVFFKCTLALHRFSCRSESRGPLSVGSFLPMTRYSLSVPLHFIVSLVAVNRAILGGEFPADDTVFFKCTLALHCFSCTSESSNIRWGVS